MISQKERDEILNTITQLPLSDPSMDSTRNLILLYLSEKLNQICEDNDND